MKRGTKLNYDFTKRCFKKEKKMSKLITPKFRVAFPEVFKAADKYNTGKAFYSIAMLFDLEEINKDPSEKARWDALVAAVDETALAKWGKLPASWKKPFKKGDEQRNKESGEIYNGFEGMVVLNAKSETQPGVVDHDRTPIMDAKDFYGGCYAIATVNCYAWNHPAHGKGVSFGLQNVMKREDGETFGGGKSKAEDDFAAIPAATPAKTNAGDLFD